MHYTTKLLMYVGLWEILFAQVQNSRAYIWRLCLHICIMSCIHLVWFVWRTNFFHYHMFATWQTCLQHAGPCLQYVGHVWYTPGTQQTCLQHVAMFDTYLTCNTPVGQNMLVSILDIHGCLCMYMCCSMSRSKRQCMYCSMCMYVYVCVYVYKIDMVSYSRNVCWT
jgi:hypothetical protein